MEIQFSNKVGKMVGNKAERKCNNVVINVV